MKHMSQFDYDEREIERAITFLARSLTKPGHNTKPVLLHSIRTASILWNNGIPQKYVVAAILHDVVEDTDVSKEDIVSEFGADIGEMVDILSLTEKNDVEQSFKSSFSDMNLAAIRAADLIENSYYYSRADTEELRSELADKYTRFMEAAKGKIPNTIYDALVDSFEKNVKPITS